MNGSSAPTARRELPASVVFALLTALLSLVPLWVSDYLPTHDGPQHVFGSYLVNHLHDPGTGYDRYFQPGYPLSSFGFTGIFSVLEMMMPWRLAYALTLTIITQIWAWGFVALCRAVHRDRWLVGLVGFTAALQWALYMGMFSFVLATGIGFFVLARAFARSPWTSKDRLAIGALLTLQACSHVFAAGACGLILGLLTVVRAPTMGRRLRDLAWLLIISLPTLTIGALVRGAPPASKVSSGDALTLIERLAAPASLFFCGPWWRQWPLTLLCLCGLSYGWFRLIKKQGSQEERVLTLGATLFLLLAVALPINLPGWDYASPRFLPYGAMFALALLPSEALASWTLTTRRAVITAGSGLLLLNLTWQTLYSIRLWESSSDILEATQAPLVRDGARLPIILNPTADSQRTPLSNLVPFALPLRNSGALFALEQGGFVPYLFASIPTLHPHVMRQEALSALPPVPDRGYVTPLFTIQDLDPLERITIINYLLSFADHYQDTIVSGTNADLGLVLERGFDVDFRNASTLIARFRGCPATLHVREHEAHPLLVSFGWFPSLRPSKELSIAASAEPRTVDLPGAPCGMIWLRVVLDTDNSGELNAGDEICSSAAPDGIFLTKLGHTPRSIECQLRPVR